LSTPADPPPAAIDALYRLPLAEFTAVRNALVATLRKAGDRAGAARVAALEKPPASAWAVNALYWTERKLFDAFLAAGKRLATAQRSGGADAFREAQKERKDALLGLMKKAGSLLEAAGHAATPATLGRVSQTLESLAVRGGAPEAMTLGQLSVDLEPPGFDAFAGLSFAAPAPAPALKKVPKAEGGKVDEGRARRAAIEEAREAVMSAEAEQRRLKKAMAEAAAAADKARAAQREAEAALSEASQKARRATETAEKAGFEARRAGTALAEAERAVEAAKTLFDRKKREL
jgi:hypothetical protein